MQNTKRKEDESRRTLERALVLIVDDEQAICKTLAQVLEDESFETITAASGPEALEKVRDCAPDLVFLDIWMPGMDGIETLEKIKLISPATEVIVISGHATISNALEATKRGAFDFIEKPLDISSVVFSATRALEKLRLTEEKRSRPVKDNKKASEVTKTSKTPLLQHPGVCSQGLKGKNFGQRTLAQGVVLYGHCLHSGQKSGLVLEPLPLNSGIHFARIGQTETVPAFVDYVESTGFATTIRSGRVQAATIEHLLAALHSYHISNLLIKCNDEVPIFDGSAQRFCEIIESIGIEEQGGDWFEVVVDSPISFHAENNNGKGAIEQISIEPAPYFSVAYELLYPEPIGRQYYEFILDGADSFREQIAPARTFGFMKDVEHLQKAGLAAGGRLDNFVLIGPDKVLNTELRFPEELARHKILDVLGDLFLLGRPLRGRVRARMTGHSDNVNILRLIRDKTLS